jgi:hypothetical protein
LQTFPKFQRDFLIGLAPVWLACRWRIMGNSLIGKCWPRPNVAFDLVGMMDYSIEMRLICQSVLQDLGVH